MKLKLVLFLLITTALQAQVGINTSDPQADLHVGGSMLLTEQLKLTNLPTVTSTDEDFKLIARKSNGDIAGELKLLNTEDVTVAPVNIIEYAFINIDLDDIEDLDLQYDSSKYIVAVSNFRYEGDAIKKVTTASTTDANAKSIGNFVVNTFDSDGTWHLEIRNRTLDLSIGDSINYYVSLVIYDKRYYRNLPEIVTNLSGNNNGTASSIPDID